MDNRIFQRMIVASICALSLLNANATTYTFIGPVDPENGNPLYTTVANWENSSYPGNTISANDTVIINSYCVTQSINLQVQGYLEVNEDLDGAEIGVSSSGHLTISTSSRIGNPIRSSGLISGNGMIGTVLICEGCTVNPGGVAEVGSIIIQTLLLSDFGNIVVDVLGYHDADVILGNTVTGTGDLLLNYLESSPYPGNCTIYNVFQFTNKESLTLRTLGALPYSSLLVELDEYKRIVVTRPFQGDRALHFDGSSDYASMTGALGEVNTIEFRFTPDQSGPAEPGQMLFHFNNELLQYVNLNNTTSAYNDETLMIKNEQAIGDNSLHTTHEFVSGQTYHVSIVAHNGLYDSIYVNGTPVESIKGASFPPVYYVESLVIGKRFNSFHYKGKMDEIRLWSDIRTPQEINDNALSQLSASDTVGLQLYYKFDQGIPYENNTCTIEIKDEMNQNNAALSNFNLQSYLQISNWVYAGCRRLSEPTYNEFYWGPDSEWKLNEVPNSQCDDVLIYPPNGLPFTVSDTTHAKCYTLTVWQDGPFVIEFGGTLEVMGH